MLSSPATTSSSDAEINKRSLNSSTSSPFSPSFSLFPYQIQTPRTMEEVWKDTSLSSSTHHTAANSSSFRVQDSLTGPFRFATAIDPAKTPPLPASALTLNSNLDSHFYHLTRKASKVETFKNPFRTLAPFSNPLSSLGNERLFESSDHCNSPEERRNKRMMKNRESAARSRARKQAYTHELQQKLKHLMEENARLKRQGQPLCTATKQERKKSRLYRASSAPF